MVRQYQAGDQEAAGIIIKNFEGFLVKFLNLVKGTNAKLDISGNSLLSFISLYIKSGYIRKRIRAHWKYPDVTQEILQRVSWIHEMFKDFSREEIYSELVIILLEMVKAYKVRDDGVYCFHTYVFKAYHFRLFRRLQKIISDPTVYASNRVVSYQGHHIPIEDDVDNIDLLAFKRGYLVVDDDMDSVNDNWINGITCAAIFVKMEVLDRKILQLYYANKLSDQGIADKLGLCRATVNRKRLAAKRFIFANHKLDEYN